LNMEDVIIIGSGQAGLGVSYFLKRANGRCRGTHILIIERPRGSPA
jgi:cation diffusion facilitator CzcD-associated flavoprotein CzcO